MKYTTSNLRLLGLAGAIALGSFAASCGSDGDGGGSAPPRRDAPDDDDDDDDGLFALESGTWFVDRVTDIQDGCNSQPLEGNDPITSTPFTLSNPGNGKIVIDRCSYNGSSIQGDVLDNKGVLVVRHAGRKEGTGEFQAQWDQDCRFEITVTGDNQIQGRFTETETNRNDVMRALTVDVPQCSTSYNVEMSKRKG